MDGTGAPGATADVGITRRANRRGRRADRRDGATVIDAQRPGRRPRIHRRAHARRRDRRPSPGRALRPDGRDDRRRRQLRRLGRRRRGGLEREIEKTGVAVNYATLFGHNTVRRAVMGTERRAPTAEELSRMQALVGKAMTDGAVGFSTGLQYVPGHLRRPVRDRRAGEDGGDARAGCTPRTCATRAPSSRAP